MFSPVSQKEASHLSEPCLQSSGFLLAYSISKSEAELYLLLLLVSAN